MRYVLALAACLLPLRICAEQMETVRIMPGTPHETACVVKRGDVPGPTVFVIGGMHGDEKAGYLAARALREVIVTTGTLIVISDGHVTAIKANQRAYPGNLNTQFPGNPKGTLLQQTAAQMWSLLKAYHPDLLITLHESVGFHRQDPTRFGQTLTYDFHALDPAFKPVIADANQQLAVPRHHFSACVYPCLGCPTYCAYKYLRIPAVSIETCRQLDLQTRIQHQLLLCSLLMARWGLKWDVPPPQQT